MVADRRCGPCPPVPPGPQPRPPCRLLLRGEMQNPRVAKVLLQGWWGLSGRGGTEGLRVSQ